MVDAPKTLDRNDLEHLIADVRDAASIANTILDAIFETEVENDGFGYVAGEHTYRLTKEQDRALVAAMLQMCGEARKLEETFLASEGPIA